MFEFLDGSIECRRVIQLKQCFVGTCFALFELYFPTVRSRFPFFGVPVVGRHFGDSVNGCKTKASKVSDEGNTNKNSKRSMKQQMMV